MHEVLVNRLGGLSLPRKSVVRLTDRPDMTLDVYRGRKTTMQQKCNKLRKKNSAVRFELTLTLELYRVLQGHCLVDCAKGVSRFESSFIGIYSIGATKVWFPVFR